MQQNFVETNHSVIFIGCKSLGSRDTLLFICSVTSRDCFIERSSELYVAPVKFGGRGNRGYGNILLFIYHMTSRDHIIKELRNFFYSKPLFIFYRFFRSRDIYILLCFSLTTYDHMIKGSCDILCSSPLSLVQSCHVWWLLERKIYWSLFVT